MYGESFQTQLGYKMCDCISNKDNVAENNLCAEIIKVNINTKMSNLHKILFSNKNSVKQNFRQIVSSAVKQQKHSNCCKN